MILNVLDLFSRQITFLKYVGTKKLSELILGFPKPKLVYNANVRFSSPQNYTFKNFVFKKKLNKVKLHNGYNYVFFKFFSFF